MHHTWDPTGYGKCYSLQPMGNLFWKQAQRSKKCWKLDSYIEAQGTNRK